MYIASTLLSIFTLVLSVVMMFSEEDSEIFKFFGFTELIFLTSVSLILLLLGYIIDRKKEREEEE